MKGMKQGNNLNIAMVLLIFFMLLKHGNAQDFTFWKSYCASTAPAGSGYAQNMDSALSDMVAMSTKGSRTGSTQAGKMSSSDLAQAIYYCRGKDFVSSAECQACVSDGAKRLAKCTSGNEAIAWYAECTVRVANDNILALLETQPAYVIPNPPGSETFTPDSSIDANTMGSVMFQTLEDAKQDTDLHFGANSYETFYAIAQCSPELSVDDCDVCLQQALLGISQCTTCDTSSVVMSALPTCQFLTGFDQTDSTPESPSSDSSTETDTPPTKSGRPLLGHSKSGSGVVLTSSNVVKLGSLVIALFMSMAGM